jgi:hypothetical protein
VFQHDDAKGDAMLEAEVHLLKFNREMLHRQAVGLTDANLTEQPGPGVNTPLWILAHLAICNDYFLDLVGMGAKTCPAAWHEDFGPNSTPNAHRHPAPTLAELVAAFDRGVDEVAKVAGSVSAARMAEPNPLEFLRARFPTVGLLLSHLCTTHAAMHLGQLSAWRRLKGLSPA